MQARHIRRVADQQVVPRVAVEIFKRQSHTARPCVTSRIAGTKAGVDGVVSSIAMQDVAVGATLDVVVAAAAVDGVASALVGRSVAAQVVGLVRARVSVRPRAADPGLACPKHRLE